MVKNNQNITSQNIWQILQTVCDPEIPVLTIIDLGIVKNVKINDKEVEIFITPTYTGCPAMETIATDIKQALIENGFTNIKITTLLSPAWTTDWMSEEGKKKLLQYGIAPPNKLISSFSNPKTIACPQCKSTHTKLISQFGSTTCKALYQCNDCKEPFEYFKCH